MSHVSLRCLLTSALLFATLSVVGSTTAGPAEAATTTPAPSGLKQESRTATSVTLDWNDVAGAPRYRIQLATNSRMSGATYYRFWASEGTISGLKPGTVYYAKTKVISASGANLSPYSEPALKFTTVSTAIPSTVQGLRAESIGTDDATIRWDAVPTATRYRLYWSTSSNMPGACEPNCRIVTPTDLANPSITLKTLIGSVTPGQTYYLKVSALNASGKTITGWQATPTKVTLTPATAPTRLRFVTMANTSAELEWDDSSGAPGYRIQLSTQASMAGATYYRFWESKGTVANLEPGTTYYAKVKTITTEGENLSAYSEPAATGTTTDRASELTVASFNVKCASCLTPEADRLPTELPWEERRDNVAETIVSRTPDVVGIQEASQAWIYEDGKQVDLSQFEDLRDHVRAAGGDYQLTNANRNNCERPTTPTGCVPKDQGASKGTKILYNTSTLKMISQGSEALEKATSAINERFLAWAILEQKSSGRRFFFGSTHLEPGTSYYDVRATHAGEALAEIERVNTSDLPVIMVGDLNSTRYAEPTNAPYDVFVASGLVDPLGHTYKSPKISSRATAESRVNANYNSYGGFSPKQRRYGDNENGSNLDYILTTPMRVTRWETVVNPGPDGDLIGPIPSDHNMVVADLLLGG